MAGELIDASDLPDYSGEPTLCVKCTGTGATSYWIPSTVGMLTNGQLVWLDTPNAADEPGWQARGCRNCGYTWCERSADNADPVVPLTVASEAEGVRSGRQYVVVTPYDTVLYVDGSS